MAKSAPKPKPKTQSKRQKPEHDIVEEAGEESFPASDPPSWTPVESGGPKRVQKKN